VRPESAAHIQISGRVQGVGYRFFAQKLAAAFGLGGWVRNLPDGKVEIDVEGSRPAIEVFVEQLEKGPPLARVDEVRVDWSSSQNQYASFSIR
jgi:acylphosphatase